MHIQQAILHILDKESGNLLMSELVMDLSDLVIRQYLQQLLAKVQQSDIKVGTLDEGHQLREYWQALTPTFVDKTKQVARQIYDMIAPAEEIASADYVFIDGVDDEEKHWIGFIRLDYSLQYTHFLQAEEGVVNQLICHRTILPNKAQKPTEAFLLNLTDGTYQLLEKRYVIEGEKVYYLSEHVLQLPRVTTTPQQITQLKQVVNQVAKQFAEPVHETLAHVQQVVHEQLENAHFIEPMTVVEKVFAHNDTARVTASNLLDQKEVPETIEVTNVPKYEKKYSKQKFKLDNGIEIVIPMELYGNTDVVEFINQPDGTISVVIKNIDSIKNLFK